VISVQEFSKTLPTWNVYFFVWATLTTPSGYSVWCLTWYFRLTSYTTHAFSNVDNFLQKSNNVHLAANIICYVPNEANFNSAIDCLSYSNHANTASEYKAGSYSGNGPTQTEPAIMTSFLSLNIGISWGALRTPCTFGGAVRR